MNTLSPAHMSGSVVRRQLNARFCGRSTCVAGDLARQLASRAGEKLSNLFDILISLERDSLVCGQRELLAQRIKIIYPMV